MKALVAVFTSDIDYINASFLENEFIITVPAARKLLIRMEEEDYLAQLGSNRKKGRKVLRNQHNKERIAKIRTLINTVAVKKTTNSQKNKQQEESTQVIMHTPPTSVERPNSTGKKRKFEGFEVSNSQDPLTPARKVDEDMEMTAVGAELPMRMSTVANPIAQKKRKLYRDPKTSAIGLPMHQEGLSDY
jgi:hypothetical protein